MRIKHILTGLIILVVGVIAALVAIIKSTDFNAYKDVVTSQVKAVTGRDLVLAGNVEASISLTPHLVVHQVSFRNADSGSEPQMLTFETIEAEIELLPLLSNEIRIKRIKLVGADILLETDKDGKGNWVMGAGGASGGNSSVPLPIIQEVVIDQARVRYRDGQTGKLSAVTIDRLIATAPGPADPISLDLTGTINQAPVALKGSIGNLKLFAQGPLPVDLSGEIAKTAVSVHGQITAPATASGLQLDVSIAGQSMADLGPLFEVTMPGFGPYQATGHLTDPEGKFKIESLAGKIGSTDLTGTVEIDPVAEPTDIVARIASSRLDLADIGAGPGAARSKDDGRVFSADPWDLSGLKAINGQFWINAQQLIRGEAALQNAAAEFAVTDGLLQVINLTAGLGEGSVGFAANVNAAPDVPTVEARIKATNVDGAPFMAAMGMGGALQAGRVNLEASLEGPGQSLRGLMAGLNGSVHMDMGRGAIRDQFAKLLFADIFKLLSTGGSGGSEVNCVVANFDIAAGIAKSRGLILDTPGATVVGAGNIDLGNETLGLRFDTNSKQVNLANLAVPILVTGSMSSPTVAPDPLGAVQNTADFATRTVNLATFGVLSTVTGLGESQDLGPNPCQNALDAGQKAGGKTGSAGDKIIDGLGTAAEGVGQGAQELGEGAVDATKKAGEGVGKALENLGDGLGGVFGN